MEEIVLQRSAALTSFAEIRDRARQCGPRRIGVVLAEDDVSLTAASDALREGIASPVLIGDPERMRARAVALGLYDLIARAEFVSAPHDAPAAAVRLARAGQIEILMKGHLRTDELLHPILDRELGLRTGRLMHDVAFFEHRAADPPRLVAISDGGLNVMPTLEQKRQIVCGVIDALHRMGVARPRIALMSAVEVVSDAMPSTVEAHALTTMAASGAFGDAEVYGPLALDNALFPWAAEAKGIHHPVAGHADALVVPSIEAGNLMAKAIMFVAGREFAHVVVGAQTPILIPSRVESARDKLNSIALGVLYAGH